MNEPSGNSNNEASNGDSARSWTAQLARYSQIGFTLPAATGAGWLLGTFLDRSLHTSWLYLAGLLCGIAGGFIELIRLTSKCGRSGAAK